MLQKFFTVYVQNHPVSNAIRDSVWVYAFDQVGHLIGLAVFAGAILIVDLRLLGFRLTNTPVSASLLNSHPGRRQGSSWVLITGPLPLSTDPIATHRCRSCGHCRCQLDCGQ